MRRIVLRRDTIEGDLERVAEDLGWLEEPEFAREPTAFIRQVYQNGSGRRVLWVGDAHTGWQYLHVADVDEEDWRRVALARDLIVSHADALNRFRQAQDVTSICDATLLLGLFAYGPLDPEIFAALAAALLSASDEVQSAALTALTFSGWPEFGPMLRTAMAETGSPAELLNEACQIADRMDEEDWHRAFYASDP